MQKYKGSVTPKKVYVISMISSDFKLISRCALFRIEISNTIPMERFQMISDFISDFRQGVRDFKECRTPRKNISYPPKGHREWLPARERNVTVSSRESKNIRKSL